VKGRRRCAGENFVFKRLGGGGCMEGGRVVDEGTTVRKKLNS